jgi:ketosteroid isomerase-like protein
MRWSARTPDPQWLRLFGEAYARDTPPDQRRRDAAHRPNRAWIPYGNPPMTLPDLAIRARRAAFNRALGEADLAAIGPLLAPDAILVTGTDSAVLSGRKAQLLAWKREFASPVRTIYTRTPDTITISSIEPIALEHGNWQGIAAGASLASGRYVAKWRRIGADWMIEAEIYLTLA